ncbi:hypothetical protein QYM36_011210 [Artemia franciscana]|uniref:Tetraspanin n=1 Tax=Artemia franciscana TaxID=6661 RepID=A0AA88HWX0_ARTSF|nr:hypothetical protein QYM36_011210 [Artemia franciscana]
MATPESRLTYIKYALFFYNFLGVILGVALFGLACWAYADWDFKYFINTLEMRHFHDGTAVLLTAAILAALAPLIGCLGAMGESRGALLVYGILCIVACIFELAGAAYILDNSTIWSKGTFWLKDRFYQLIYETQRDNRAYEIMRVIQEHVQCCGSYKYYDYSDVHIPIPNECRNQITGNVHKYGCHEIFSHYLSTRSGPLAGVALALFILQIYDRDLRKVLRIRAVS